MKVVIVGASIAGHTVAVSLRQAVADCSITLITRSAYPAYDKRRLLDYLTGGVKEKDLFLVPPDFYGHNGINFLKECEVTSVAPVRKQLSYRNKADRRESLEYDRLVVCSGARTVLPEVDGIHKEGVYTLDSLADFKSLRSHLISDPVCIMGSGGNALSLAHALAGKQKEVKVISRDAPPADPPVEMIATDVVELIGEGGIQALRLAEGKIIGTNLPVFMPEPKKASTDFLKDIELDPSGRIVVDEAMCTSVPAVYASGAVCARKDSAQDNKSWDDVINESRALADRLVHCMGG